MDQYRQHAPISPLVAFAAFVIIIAGIRAATPIVVPFLLSAFIAVISAPPLFWLRQKKIPMVFALIIVISAITLGIIGIVTVLGASLDDFSRNVPDYQARLTEQASAFIAWLAGFGIHLPQKTLMQYLDAGRIMGLVAQSLASFSGVLANAFLIILTVIFMLMEAYSFPKKLHAIVADPDRSLATLQKILDDLKKYMAIKSVVSVLTGLLITIWLTLLGVDYPVLWGFVAFLLNFVPNIGSIIAALPAVLLALIQFNAVYVLLVAAGYVAVNFLVGNLLEPRLMGRQLGLSTLVVFLSLIFWGWVLGPVGMILSVPLTMLVRIALQGNESTNWIAVLLGPETLEVAPIAATEATELFAGTDTAETPSKMS